jgi:signal transduction histidine kinase
LGYLLLSILVLGAFVLGLIYILNGSTVLYRQAVGKLQGIQASLETKITSNPKGYLPEIKKYIDSSNLGDGLRVLVISDAGVTLYDSNSAAGVNLRWLRFAALRRVADQNSSALIRDNLRRVWIYVATKLPDSQDYLVIASLRQNLTWKFMVSDPMVRLIIRVGVWSMLVSFLLTLLMDHWIARPIRKMVKQASTLGVGDGRQLPVEGISEVKDLAIAINKMSLQVQQSHQSQRDLVGDVSHELKTPLTSIQGFSAAILDGTASTPMEVKHSAEVISVESQRMLDMVNELLTLARLEGRVDKLDLRSTDLNAILDGVIEKISKNALQAKVKIINLTPELPEIVVDSGKITQVLLNLLDNAIKFTPPEGQITITGKIESDKVNIGVSDTGTGIAPDELPKIFNRFYQVDRSRKGGVGKSSGLGLTISREIIRMHNGEISVSSKPEVGTTFTVLLPYKKIKEEK